MTEIDYFKQGATKCCVFADCKSDSRRVSTAFLSFPKPCLAVRKQLENGDKKHISQCSLCARSNLWLSKCRRENFSKLTHVKKWHYICVLHFVNGIGPTAENPFPLPASEAVLRMVKHRKVSRKRKAPENQTGCFPTVFPGNKINKTDHVMNLDSSANFVNAVPEAVPDLLSEPQAKPLPTVDSRNNFTQTTLSLKFFSNLEDQNKKLKGKMDAYKIKLHCLRKVTAENGRLKAANTKLQQENENLKKKLQKKTENSHQSFEKVTSFVESLRKNDRKCKFYTVKFMFSFFFL